MFNQKSIILLFIERNRFQFCGGSLPSIVTIDVPESIIHDLDVIQKDAFYTLIKQWVKQYNLIASELVIVFSESSYFEKIFSSAESTQVETDILKFFDTVPYESIWTKVYPAPGGKRAVGVNKALYDAIHQGFSLQGVSTRAVLPAFALGAESHKHILDSSLFDYVVKNIDVLGKQSLFDNTELVIPASPGQSDSAKPQKKNSRLPLLLGVFGFLMLILVVFIVLRPH